MKTRGRKQNTRHTRRRRTNNILKNMRGGTATENPVTGTVSVCDEEGNRCLFVVPATLPASSGINDETKLVWNAFINFFRVGGIGADDLYSSIKSICTAEESVTREENVLKEAPPENLLGEEPEPTQGVATEESPLADIDVANQLEGTNERPGENLLEGGKRRRYRY
jgi:hypothetical protein